MKNKYLLRLIIATIAFTILATIVLFISVALTDNLMLSAILIPLLLGCFFLYLVFGIFLPYRKDLLKKNSLVVPNQMTINKDINGLIKISTHPILASIVLPKYEYYFDETTLYEVRDSGVTAEIAFANIIIIKKTGTQVNNRRVWLVKHKDKYGREHEARFLHNYTLRNKSFKTFLELVQRINPQANVSRFSIWSM